VASLLERAQKETAISSGKLLKNFFSTAFNAQLFFSCGFYSQFNQTIFELILPSSLSMTIKDKTEQLGADALLDSDTVTSISLWSLAAAEICQIS